MSNAMEQCEWCGHEFDESYDEWEAEGHRYWCEKNRALKVSTL